MPLNYLSFFSNCVSDRFDSGLVWIGDLVDMMIQMFYEVKIFFWFVFIGESLTLSF